MSYTYIPRNAEIENLLMCMLPDENGEVPALYDYYENQLSEKLTQQYDGFTDLCRFYKDFESQVKAINEEIEALKRKREVAEMRMERMMNFMKGQLGEEAHTFGAFTFSSRKTPAVLTYNMPNFKECDLIAWCKQNKPELVQTKVTETLDKDAAKKACKNNQLPGEVELVAGRKWTIK